MTPAAAHDLTWLATYVIVPLVGSWLSLTPARAPAPGPAPMPDPEPTPAPAPIDPTSRTIGDVYGDLQARDAAVAAELAAAKAAYEAELARIDTAHEAPLQAFAAALQAVGAFHVGNPDGSGVTYVSVTDASVGFRTINTVAASTKVVPPAVQT